MGTLETTPVIVQRGDMTVIIPRHSRIGRAMLRNPFASTEARIACARRLARAGYTDVYVPGAGWVQTAHLARCGWCP